MDDSTIVYVDRSRIREGKGDEVAAGVRRLSDFIRERNPRILAYRFYVDVSEGTMTVVSVHPDSDALAFHMDVGDAEFRKFAPLLEIVSIDVFGEVTGDARERLDRKARALGGAVRVHRATAGFSR